MLFLAPFFCRMFALRSVILAPWYDFTFSLEISASPPVSQLRAASSASVEATPLEVAFQVTLCTATVVACWAQPMTPTGSKHGVQILGAGRRLASGVAPATIRR